MEDRIKEKLPLARQDGLLVTQLESGEMVVYDRQRDRVHCLNPTLVSIWKACDGSTSVADLCGELQRSLGLPPDEAILSLGLGELKTAHLLQEYDQVPEVSRREALRRLGVGAAALLPLLTTVVAPTPAQAGTGLPPGSSCTSGYQCRSGICVGGVCA